MMDAKFFFMVVGITAILLQACNAQEGFCIEPYKEIADRCYRFHQTTADWHSAEMSCAMEGARLASVLNPEQYTGLLEHINRNYPGTYWISGVPRNGQWVWGALAGTPPMNSIWWGYRSVPAATPGRCSYFCSNTHKYWAQGCMTRDRFICEKDLMVIRGVSAEVELDELEPFDNVIPQ